ncbi:MAG: SGNH/GDSL hydrolase family protein [Gemmatimonadota bacterium]|nr:SGNH/GDSL hydrolase family protein [Gemmatimonadota bacterium]
MQLFTRCGSRLSALLLACSAASAQSSAANAPLRVLFIGNSYIYVNDLPLVVADLAKAAHEPRPLEAEVVVAGGYTLEHHLTQGDAMHAIARGRWDVVVLQEQSTRPITDPEKMLRDVKPFADAARKSGARMVLYETWAREATPRMQDSLSNVYHTAAASIGAKVAHVGDAWGAFRAQEGALAATAHSVLFMDDGSHPSPTGTYLAASVVYATIYGKSPIGLPAATRSTFDEPKPGPAPDAPPASVPLPLAKKLQELAWAAARK